VRLTDACPRKLASVGSGRGGFLQDFRLGRADLNKKKPPGSERLRCVV